MARENPGVPHVSHASADLRVGYHLQILLEKANGVGLGVPWDQGVWGRHPSHGDQEKGSYQPRENRWRLASYFCPELLLCLD